MAAANDQQPGEAKADEIIIMKSGNINEA